MSIWGSVSSRMGWVAMSVAAVTVFVADRVTKALVVSRVVPNEGDSVPVLGKVASITHVHNTGVAFGMFTNRNFLFGVLSIVVLAIIVNFYRYLPGNLWWLRVSLGLQVGGAVGNLVDRVRQGYVTDFVDFHFWPVFNVADSSICIGVAMLAIYLLLHGASTGDAQERVSHGSPRVGEHPRVSN